MFYGPKCTAEVSGIALPMCLSAVLGEHDGLTHVFLNFCVINQIDDCKQKAAPSPIYVSLLLPAPGWAEGRHHEAAAGRVEVALPDGRRFRRDSGRGEALPMDLSVRRQPNGPNATTLFGELTISLPPVDGAGEPIALRARVN